MISIDQLIKLIGLILIGICILALLGVVIHLVLDAAKDLKDIHDPKPKKRYWIIKYYNVCADFYGTACVKARSKSEALYKFHNDFEYSKKVLVVDVKEVTND